MIKPLIFTVLALFVTMPVFAAGGQYGQYGNATPTQSLIVDKMVGKGPMTKGGVIEYVDNLLPTDTRFTPGQAVYFLIKVKNPTNQTLSQVRISDTIPDYTDAAEGPGAYDPASRTISWTYPSIQPGEEKTEKITLMIRAQDTFPSDKTVFCLTNKVAGTTGESTDDDSSQFCVEKKVALTKGGVPPKAPDAGPEFGFAVSALSLAGMSAGIYLNRITRKKKS